MNNLDILISKIESLLINSQYDNDLELIKNLLEEIKKLKLNNFNNELLDDIDKNIQILDQKYDDLYDLVNIFDVLKYKYKKELKKQYVENLRKNNRSKKTRN